MIEESNVVTTWKMQWIAMVDALVGDAHTNVNQQNNLCLVIEESNANNDLSKVIKEACTMENIRMLLSLCKMGRWSNINMVAYRFKSLTNSNLNIQT